MHSPLPTIDNAAGSRAAVLALSRNNPHRNWYAILKPAGIETLGRCFQVLHRSLETEWSERLPRHAVSAWLGHCEIVSREHYLQVTDSMPDRAAGLSDSPSDPVATKSAAKSVAASSRIRSQGLANGQSDGKASPRETPCFLGSNAENGDGPGGIRTPDQAIMSRRL